MTYNDEKERLVESILKDPAGFLLNQFKEGGAFADSERIFLTITVWESDEFGYSMEAYLAYNRWEKPETWECTSTSPPVYTNVDDQPEFMPAYAMEDAEWAWRHYKANIPAPTSLPEHAWFFPGGLAEALDGTSWLDYASNVPSETKEE